MYAPGSAPQVKLDDTIIHNLQVDDSPEETEDVSAQAIVVPPDTILNDSLEESKVGKNKKSKRKKRIGRPKKRGPKKGSKRNKGGESKDGNEGIQS
jgi:hypothetical protein